MYILLCCQIHYNRSHRICRKGKGLVVKKPMDLCGRESEDHDHGVGAGVNVIIMSDVLYWIDRTDSVSSTLTCHNGNTKGLKMFSLCQRLRKLKSRTHCVELSYTLRFVSLVDLDIRQTIPVWVVITDSPPVYKHSLGCNNRCNCVHPWTRRGGSGECELRNVISDVIPT